jgi:predicted dehydrogenase
MSTRLGVGIIGVGRRWPRFRAALRVLRGQFAVRAVCDQRPGWAEHVARQVGAAVAAGPVELLHRDDVRAVLLLARQWFGLWPLTVACQHGKPVFCAVSLDQDEDHADALAAEVLASRLPVMMALPWEAAPALALLGELLTASLGAPRFVQLTQLVAGPFEPSLLPPLHLALRLFGDIPSRVWAAPAGSASLLQLAFAGDRVAQVSRRRTAGPISACRIEVEAERGRAIACLPGRLRWRTGPIWHHQHLHGPALEEALLHSFREALEKGEPPQPDFTDVHQALTLLRTVRNAQSEGTASR